MARNGLDTRVNEWASQNNYKIISISYDGMRFILVKYIDNDIFDECILFVYGLSVNARVSVKCSCGLGQADVDYLNQIFAQTLKDKEKLNSYLKDKVDPIYIREGYPGRKITWK